MLVSDTCLSWCCVLYHICQAVAAEGLRLTSIFWGGVQTQMSWRTLLTIW